MRLFIFLFSLSAFFLTSSLHAQTNNLLDQVKDDNQKSKKYISNAFKSSRVINNQSMEMIGKGVLDMRILHRFGLINSGIDNFFGLDQANFRLGLDYGISKNLTAGVGRSTYLKELDGFIKWRIVQQSEGYRSIPVSLVWVSGLTVNTIPVPQGERAKPTGDRIAYYYEIIIGRKFNQRFSWQVNPILVHRNRVDFLPAEENNVYALGTGFRFKLTRRTAFVVDYDYILSGLNKNFYENPLAIGFDIETGGHVFQLHFSNSIGMNENAFLTHTTNKWSKGEFNFGFNLSRVFSVRKKKIT